MKRNKSATIKDFIVMYRIMLGNFPLLPFNFVILCLLETGKWRWCR